MSLMGIDVGTSGCKVVAFTEDGAVLAQAGEEYPLHSPQPGWYELDPEHVWDCVCRCLRAVNAELRRDPVSALAISSQGEAMIPISRAGKVLANSPISSDQRNRKQAAALEALLGAQQIFHITGQPISTIYTLPKILWWREHMPQLLQRAWKILCYVDFVAFRLGAMPAIDHSMAARTLAFDVQRLDWSQTMLEATGIRREQLAQPVPSGTVIGRVAGGLAAELGFQRQAQVVSGGHDQPAGALGAGILEPGKAMLSIGTTEALVAVVEGPRAEMLDSHISCYPHAAPGHFIALCGNQTGGRLLRWYRDELGAAERAEAARQGRDVYDVIVEQIEDKPGELLLLPYFVGSGTLYEDASATGLLLGLTFNSQRKDIVRAILEGLTYEVALNLAHLREIAIDLRALTAVGGGARSPRWMQIKADITGIPVTVLHTSEAASLGVAMLAGWATGVYSSLPEAAQQLVEPARTFQPRAEYHARHTQRLRLYQAAYQALGPLYEAMSAESRV